MQVLSSDKLWKQPPTPPPYFRIWRLLRSYCSAEACVSNVPLIFSVCFSLYSMGLRLPSAPRLQASTLPTGRVLPRTGGTTDPLASERGPGHPSSLPSNKRPQQHWVSPKIHSTARCLASSSLPQRHICLEWSIVLRLSLQHKKLNE